MSVFRTDRKNEQNHLTTRGKFCLLNGIDQSIIPCTNESSTSWHNKLHTFQSNNYRKMKMAGQLLWGNYYFMCLKVLQWLPEKIEGISVTSALVWNKSIKKNQKAKTKYTFYIYTHIYNINSFNYKHKTQTTSFFLIPKFVCT